MATAETDVDVEQQAPEPESRPAARWPDVVIPVVLGIVALLYRRQVPPDGLFFDDAWQALAATRGTLSQFFTVGQTQPGFGLELMMWSRVVGHSIVNMITPAIIAGTLGPPALYLVLRRFRFARSVAALMGAALAVSATHIIYSGHVKAYTSEVLFVLALMVSVPWFARRSWTVATAVGWFVGSMLIASFSSFTMLATVAAAIIVVLHPRRDLRLRVVAVAVQAVGVLALLVAVDRTHSAQMLTDYFDQYDGFISFSLNPVTFGRDVFHHLTRITDVFPGGPAWFGVVCVAAVTVGLVMAARGHGPRAIAARFMIAAVLLAFVGALAQRVPFGSDSQTSRVTLWLIPILAFGLAVVLQRVRRAFDERDIRWKVGFDVAAFSCAVLLLFTPIGVHRPYPPGWLAGTRQLLQAIGPRDAVLISRTQMYSVAFNADLPVSIRLRPDTVQGFDPLFRDPRLHTFGVLSTQERQAVDHYVKTADRVFVLEHNPDPNVYRPYRIELVKELRKQGFVRQSVKLVNQASIVVYRRR
jgi:hypothetical protein